MIVQKVLVGDRHAYAALVDEYKDMAVGIAYHILLNREDAEEIAQDAFVKAYGALYAYRGAARFSTWFYRIVVNCALNKKKLKKYPTISIDHTMHDAWQADAGNSITGLIKRAGKEQILKALETISDNERICISLYYLSELTIEEINDITGITRSNIKVLLHRGRKSLYTALQQCLRTELKDLI